MKAEMGELALFLIGILLSILLLAVLFVPFITRLRVLTFALVPATSAASLRSTLRGRLARLGFAEVQSEEADPEPSGLTLVRGSNCFVLTVEDAPDGARLHLAQIGLDPAQLERLSVLTGTALAWTAHRIHLTLRRQGLRPRWAASPDAPTHPAPTSPVKRVVVSLSPWH